MLHLLDRLRTRLWARPCRDAACRATSPHDAHLTRLGRRRYTGGR